MLQINFPYRTYQGFYCPIIPFEVKGPRGSVIVQAYVDSGAFYTILSADYFHRLHIRIGFTNLKAMIGFSDKLGVGFNLLGRKDIFSRFDVIFSDSCKKSLSNRLIKSL